MSTNNLQTPFYRVKEKDLLYDINLLKEALTKNWGNFIMGYSVKTNSLLKKSIKNEAAPPKMMGQHCCISYFIDYFPKMW